ncbi:hypothetical protein AYO42_00835 [Rhizomicrobium sp. SCGC AG-212-E05]|nr:hypothetical protein AYO42_00835 [Rhizomicrobium sp. SCGC AG-212-E05]
MTKHFRWHREFDGPFILRKFEGFRSVKDKQVTFDAYQHEFWKPILSSAIKASTDVGQLKALVLSKAMADPTLDLGDSEAFLEACEARLTALRSEGFKDYMVFFRITYVGPRPFRTLQDGTTCVVWKPSASSAAYKRARRERRKDEDVEHLVKQSKADWSEDKATDVLVHVKALSAHHAHDIAADAFDCLRGLMNFFVNRQRTVNPFGALSGGPTHAVNRFRTAPYQTVHNSDGSLAVKTIWYEPRFSHERPSIKFSQPLTVHGNIIRKWWKKIVQGQLREHLVEGYIRYGRSLDNHDQAVALTQLWSTLEMLMGYPRHDAVVSRTIKLFDEETIARQLVEHIRLRRNESVHTGQAPEFLEADTILTHADHLVRRALTFFTMESGLFKSTREALNFLDLSLDIRDLKKQKVLIEGFIKYRGKEGPWRERKKRTKKTA